MSSKVNSEKNESKEESELEEIIVESKEDSEEKSAKEKEGTVIELKKKNDRKNIIPEFTESKTRNFLNFLNRNSSVTLDRRNSFNEIPKNLEWDLEQSTPTQNVQTQNQNSNKENSFEYVSKNEQKEKAVYQNYENASGAKVMRVNELKKIPSNSLEGRQAAFLNSESGKTQKQESHYASYVLTSRFDDLQKEKKEKGILFTEAKTEYYSHDH
jgi:hypothetical protein